MKTPRHHITRRDWLRGFSTLALSTRLGATEERAAKDGFTLQNANLDFRIALAHNKVVSRRLTNKLANETVNLPETEFVLEFDGGGVMDASQFNAKVVHTSADRVQLLFSGLTEAAAGLQVRVDYQLPPSRHYLRKQLSVRQAGKATPRKLMRADLDVWDGVKRDWKAARADRMRYGSHPIFCETLWAGVEFVAAFNEHGRDGFILRSRPGGKILTPEWMPLRSTVVGVADPGKIRESFLFYIEDIRLAPPRMVACYNTWKSLPIIFNENDLSTLVQSLVEALHSKHGFFFDIVSADMGWSDPQSIWKVNHADFPTGLTRIVETIKSAGGTLGLWMSPSDTYKPVIDYEWAEKNGYAIVHAHPKRPGYQQGLSLADPKYRNAVKGQLCELIQQYQLGHIKYDGFIAREEQGHQSLLPGDDSVEPLAECALELLETSKKANPELITEPTFLNSWLNYISPWIIKYSDCVWGNAGNDCPRGLGPAPDYLEARTTAREYFIFASRHEVWLPQNALQYFDIDYCQEAGGFAHHAAMAIGRGGFFLSTYLNPKVMTDRDWQVYAGLLKWARGNQELLQNTTILPSRVELGEPYAYAHWSNFRGIIAVRNPSNESQEFTLDLAKSGAPKGLSDAVCYTQYPYRKGIKEGVSGSATITLDLAPWELVFLEIVRRRELRQPVAIGARWYREADGGMTVSPEDTAEVRILLPGSGERILSNKPLDSGNFHGEVLSCDVSRVPESDGLRQGDKVLPTSSFELECQVSTPQEAAKGRVLLLLEFPGQEHLPSTCSCWVDGRSTPLQQSSSAGHTPESPYNPDSPWRNVLPYVSQWTWYICELEQGVGKVKFKGTYPSDKCRVGVWAWADWDLSQRSVRFEGACPEPSMPQIQEHLKRRGICLLRPELPREQPSDGRWTEDFRQ
jgi:hypothetical protein